VLAGKGKQMEPFAALGNFACRQRRASRASLLLELIRVIEQKGRQVFHRDFHCEKIQPVAR
jgi:hypothetical protein